ncbi:DUF1190 domain-containing protein [Sulfitobacter guttiformis]|uniref:Uncharacterized protein YgiB involved in biofilm formation n=1 Tax=Sulfitobacter guttiformis TaxID=74349 RepID=A0A420DJ28_9RHOB|nr:DUF1190 domain-containing protein [Sulfitobacter guttiformis]KIN71970.1 putative lipoprotein [Sulfitobacter guttiformis KCTC 32187]RKE94233.1 uncharacterized protein YgiB involved in biofilm formation [Sulfitobacter guttiformis]
MIKRSNRVAIAILGATAFTLAGCREEQVDAAAFPDLQSCLVDASRGGIFTAQDCETSFAEAQTLHVEAAPRYDSLAVCEEQHGEGACGSEAAATQGGSGGIFMPLLAGYLIGNMLGGRTGMSSAQPLYKTSGGRFTDAARSSTFSTNSGSAKLNTSQFTRPAATVGKTPMTRATASSRGGFGGSGGGRTGFGG